MKNFRKIFMLITVALLMSISHTAVAMEGEGTEESPFLITNQAELETVDSFPDCHFRLENDIVLEGTWVPVCSDSTYFTGVFDGNYYTISNLTISTSREYVGLFGRNSGTIKNLKVITSESGVSYTSEGKNYVGGIVGTNSGTGTIDSCKVIGTISCKGGYYGSSSSNCYYGYAGGIAGQNDGTISQCYTEGTINGSRSYLSGIAEHDTDSSGQMLNCYSRATISGGLVEYGIGCNATNCYYAGTSNIDRPVATKGTNCFYDKTISGMSSTYYGTPKTTIAMKMKKTYTDAGWDFENVWGIDANINDGYPYLLWEYPEESSASAEIIGATSTDTTLKFISVVSTEGEPEISTFGTTFIPLWLFETGSGDVATVEYDNASYNIADTDRYGATLANIPEVCKSMNIVGKSFIKDSDGEYTWSAAKYSSVNNPTLNAIE